MELSILTVGALEVGFDRAEEAWHDPGSRRFKVCTTRVFGSTSVEDTYLHPVHSGWIAMVLGFESTILQKIA